MRRCDAGGRRSGDEVHDGGGMRSSVGLNECGGVWEGWGDDGDEGGDEGATQGSPKSIRGIRVRDVRVVRDRNWHHRLAGRHYVCRSGMKLAVLKLLP